MAKREKYQRSDYNLDLDYFIENSLDLVYIHDLKGKFLDANDLVLNTLGYKRDDLGKIKFRNLIQGDTLEKSFKVLSEILKTGKQSERTDYILKNHSDENIHLNTYGIPLRREDGEIKVILGVARDLTKQENIKTQLKRSEEKYRLILETANDLISIYNLNFETEYINESAHKKITGYLKEDMIGKIPLEYMHPEDILHVKEQFQKVLECGEASSRTRFKKKDGEYIWLESQGKLFKDENGEDKILVLSRDVTENIKFEKSQQILFDKILKESQFKSEFMTSVSHELRTPLNAIIGFTELLKENAYGAINPVQLEFLEDIESSSEHLLNMVNSVLDLSKIEAGKFELNIAPFKLHPVIEHVRSTISPLYLKKGLEFKTEINENIEIITADLLRFKQVLYNLLGNAIKFTDKGHIFLKIEKDTHFYIFYIEDTGIGIAEEDYDFVFQKFRSKFNSHSNSVGTGIGLALTKRLVELHNGDISFESELDKGTSFRFTIPI